MRGNVVHLLWFFIVSSAVASVTLIAVGRMMYANAAGENDPVVVRDEFGYGSHHLYGMVLVPETCDELQGNIQPVSTTTYEITFSTWREPSVPCADERTPRVFQETVFAPPRGIVFAATLDGRAFPISIVSTQAAH